MSRTIPTVLTLAIAASAPAANAGSSTFTTRADAACASAGAKITKLPKVTTANLETSTRDQTKIVSNLVVQLKAIQPPAAKAKRYRAFVGTLRTQITSLRAAITALENGQAALGEARLKKVSVAGRRGDKLAARLGLAACAKDYEAQG